MSERYWTYLDSQGEALAQGITHGGTPEEEGCEIPAGTVDTVEVAAPGDPVIASFKGGAWEFDAAKADAIFHAEIDAAAEEALRPFAGTASRAAIYRKKELEARDFLAKPANQRNIKGYPFMDAEAEATAQDPVALANAIVARADESAKVEVAIEAAQQAAKRGVSQAAGLEEKHAAANVDWGAVVAGAVA